MIKITKKMIGNLDKFWLSGDGYYTNRHWAVKQCDATPPKGVEAILKKNVTIENLRHNKKTVEFKYLCTSRSQPAENVYQYKQHQLLLDTYYCKKLKIGKTVQHINPNKEDYYQYPVKLSNGLLMAIKPNKNQPL